MRPAVEDLFGCSSADCKMSPVLKIPCYRLCRFAALFAGISGTRPCSTCCGKQCSRKRNLFTYILPAHTATCRLAWKTGTPARTLNEARPSSFMDGRSLAPQTEGSFIPLRLPGTPRQRFFGKAPRPRKYIRGPHPSFCIPASSLNFPTLVRMCLFSTCPSLLQSTCDASFFSLSRREPEHAPLGLYCHKARR